MKPFLLVLSSPSGGGKTTIARALLAAREDVGYSISATTRSPRQNERDGVEYYFLSREEFTERRVANEFLEWAEYSGHLYGTLASEVERILARGSHVLLDIEVEGARAVRERRTDVVSIFVLPPSAKALVDRLGGRATNRSEDVRRRLLRAVDELEEAPQYDYVVINADRTQAVAEVAAIIDAEARRPHRLPNLVQTVDELRRELARMAETDSR